MFVFVPFPSSLPTLYILKLSNIYLKLFVTSHLGRLLGSAVIFQHNRYKSWAILSRYFEWIIQVH